jgi:hypothetical protein
MTGFEVPAIFLSVQLEDTKVMKAEKSISIMKNKKLKLFFSFVVICFF